MEVNMKKNQNYKLKACLLLFSFLSFAQLFAYTNAFLAGNEKGLYQIDNYSKKRIYSKAEIYKICRAGNQWLFLTNKGILASKNLKKFYYLNNGLAKKIVKVIDKNGNKSFKEKIHQLKDLEVHPSNPNIFVTATSDSVFLTRDAGKSWQDLGCNGKVNGLKAVSVLDMSSENGEKILTVFVSHALYGIAWKQPSINAGKWNELNDGLESGPESIEEISDIAFNKNAKKTIVYCSQTFSNKIYKLDWDSKTFSPIDSKVDAEENSDKKLLCTDSLEILNNTIIAIQSGKIIEKNLFLPKTKSHINQNLIKKFNKIKRLITKSDYQCVFIPKKLTPFKNNISLSELWLLRSDEKLESAYHKKANKRKGLYIATYQVKNKKTFAKHLRTIKKNKLDTIVVDMKDDNGFVRFNAKDPDIIEKGGVRYELDLEELIKTAKENNIYLIARIVVFKDKTLYRYKKGIYAIKDETTNKAWQGYDWYNGEKEKIEEYWVDPYNEAVWEYNVKIAKELCERGFDEIQFDYIRFPTDGDNLHNAKYPAKENGMDKVSALMSFLSYARKRIPAPISIDIYGSNGWYRTGARTGQEVELIAEFVDIICPMFYPSHFAQTFLAYRPAEERPYRIYRQGSYRNKIIARNKVLIRPWVQAFYIPVSYDRKYYDVDYVKRQILGIADSIDEGYIYWNNSGRYDDIRPDGEALK